MKTTEYKTRYRGKEDVKFNTDFRAVLVTDLGEFERIVNSIENTVLAIDTETTGLNFDNDYVIGVSFSINAYSGYYVPIRHRIGDNLNDGKEFSDIENRFRTLLQKLLYTNKVLFYNSTFDLLMLQKEGIDIDKVKCLDVLALVYNFDSNLERNGLKEMSQLLLGRNPIQYGDIVDKGQTMEFISSEDVLDYAVSDSANTFGLYDLLKSILQDKRTKFIVELDNRLAKAMTYYLTNKVTVDANAMKEMLPNIQKRVNEIEQTIYKEIGEEINLNSTQQLGVLLEKLGLDTNQRTASGNMKVSQTALKNIDHPLIRLIEERRVLVKQVGTYIEKLAKFKEGRINYFIYKAPTGRIISGSDKNSNYYLPLNLQTLTKPQVAYFKAEKKGDVLDPKYILGYEFTEVDVSEVEKGKNYVESYSKELNVRRAITVPSNDYVFVSIDYESQEVRLAGLLSNDNILVDAFANNKDPHKELAIKMFGKENYNNVNRKKAKIASFSLQYLGCFTEDTLILTKRGLLTIKNIYDNRIVDRVRDLEKIWTGKSFQGGKVLRQGEKDFLNLMFDDGTKLEMSLGHRAIILRNGKIQEVKASELIIGDYFISDRFSYTWTGIKNDFNFLNFVDEEALRKLVLFVYGTSFFKTGREFYQDEKIKFYIDKDNVRFLPFKDLINQIKEELTKKQYKFDVIVTDSKKATKYLVEIDCPYLCEVLKMNLGQNVEYRGVTTLLRVDQKYLEWFFKGLMANKAFHILQNRVFFRFCNLNKLDKVTRKKEEYIIKAFMVLLKTYGIQLKLYKAENTKITTVVCYLQKKDLDLFKVSPKKFLFPQDKRLIQQLINRFKREDSKLEFEKIVTLEMLRARITKLGLNNKYSFLDKYHFVRLKNISPGGVKIGYDISIQEGPIKHYYADGYLTHNSSWTLKTNSNLSMDECNDLYKAYWNSMQGYSRWIKTERSEVYKNGGVTRTLLGRPRYLQFYLSNEKLRKHGERLIPSHRISGSAADIMRVTLVKLFEKIFKNPEFHDEIKFVATIHDEISYVVRRDKLLHYLNLLEELMEFKLPNWAYPLTVSFDVGRSFGETFPFRKTKLNEYKPKFL